MTRRRKAGVESEESLLRKTLQLAALTGWLSLHVRPARRLNGSWYTPLQGSGAGYPDLTLVHPARRIVTWAELKSETGGVSADQAVWLEGLRAAGQRAEVWRPESWGEIEALLTGK